LALDLGEDELAELTLENKNLTNKLKQLQQIQKTSAEEIQELKSQVKELRATSENSVNNIGEKTKLIQTLRQDLQKLEE
jgi:chromosome segregation ATPase